MWLDRGRLVHIESICCDRLLGWSVVARPSVVVNRILSIEYRENQTISVTSSNIVWTVMYRSVIVLHVSVFFPWYMYEYVNEVSLYCVCISLSCIHSNTGLCVCMHLHPKYNSTVL